MPVEFSVAAYRFGHSMVRPIYRLNTQLPAATIRPRRRRTRSSAGWPAASSSSPASSGAASTASTSSRSSGPSTGACSSTSTDRSRTAATKRVQPAYKIDTSLVNPLGFLPEFSTAAARAASAADGRPAAVGTDRSGERTRPTWRSGICCADWRMGLPSGQDVARAMGVEPIEDEDLRVGKAVVEDWDSNPTLASIHRQLSRTMRRSGTTCWRKRSTSGSSARRPRAGRATKSRCGSARSAAESWRKR